MKPANLRVVIDELVIDSELTARPAQLQRVLSAEIARRIQTENASLPEGAAASISTQIAQSIAARQAQLPRREGGSS